MPHASRAIRDLGVPFWLVLTAVVVPAEVAAEPLVDPSGQALDAFYRSLERVEGGEGALSRIVQFGDSHTACDLWTGALRRRLQGRFGDGGHGFVIPGRPWSQYRHLDVGHGYRDGYWKVTRLRPAQDEVAPLGLGGVALDARQDHARLRVLTSKGGPVGRSTALFDLFYLQQPGGGQIRARVDGKQVSLLSTDMAERKAAFRRFEVRDGAHHLELDSVGRGPVRIFGVVLERRGPGVVVDSVGLPGLRAESLLMSEPDLLRAHLTRRNPDLISLAFGAVEANHEGFDPDGYAETLVKVIGHLRRGAPAASCLILAPVDRAERVKGSPPWRSLPALEGIIKAQRAAAAEAGCAFWDTRAAMGGPGSIHGWYQKKMSLPDHVHLNRDGYDALAGLLEEALLEGYERFKAGRGAERSERGGQAPPESVR